MSTVRAQLAAHLNDALPTIYRVLDHAVGLDRIEAGRVVVIVYRQTVRPGAQFDRLTNDMRVWVLVPNADPARADDVLDPALDEVLAALDTTTLTTWEEAERGVFDETFIGYQITCTTNTRKA